MARRRKTSDLDSGLVKCLTGIQGLDEITEGALPRGPAR
jgi:hypothetical protein